MPTGRRSLAAVLAAALAGAAMVLAVEGFHSGVASAVAFEYPGSATAHALVREQANRAPLVLRAGTVEVVSAAVTVAEPAKLTVRAQNAAGGPLTLLAQSRVGSTVAGGSVTALQSAVRAGNIAIQLRLPAADFRGKRIAIVAVAAAGARSATARIAVVG